MGTLITFLILLCIGGVIVALIGELFSKVLPVILITVGIIVVVIIVKTIKKKSKTTPSNMNQIFNKEVQQKTNITESNGTKTIHTRIIINSYNSFSSYFSLIERGNLAKSDNERISYLEQALDVLPEFISESIKMDGELPPSVPPRDSLPELYMRYGSWERARKTVDFCYSVGALDKESYADIINLIEIRKSAANGLLEFLTNNPGFLQKNVYKNPVLSFYDHNALVWVCRSFKLIRKEKCGNTNKLYCN